MVTRHRKTEVRRQEIIDAATKLINKYGSQHLTIRQIAGKVGITEAAIYRHFPSKKSIMSLMADHIADNLLGDISKACRTANTRVESLDLTMRNHLNAIEKREGLSFRVIAEIITQGDKTLNKKVSEIINNYIDALQDLLSQGVASREIRQDVDLHGAAQLLFGMIQGLVTIWTLNNRNFSLVERYKKCWELFLCVITEKAR